MSGTKEVDNSRDNIALLLKDNSVSSYNLKEEEYEQLQAWLEEDSLYIQNNKERRTN